MVISMINICYIIGYLIYLCTFHYYISSHFVSKIIQITRRGVCCDYLLNHCHSIYHLD
jgi:hypothetical protein